LAAAVFFFFRVPAPPRAYALSLHDALPISGRGVCHRSGSDFVVAGTGASAADTSCLRSLFVVHTDAFTLHRLVELNCCAEQFRRSEEHTSELQSRENLVCRLLLEKNNKRTH